MSVVSETMVREFFELHGFFVRQQKKHVAPNRPEEEEADFLVVNPNARETARERPFILGSADLGGVAKAIVSVRGWHTEVFYPNMVSGTPELFRFAGPAQMKSVARGFAGGGSPLKIMVIPGFPSAADLRDQTIAIMKSKGIDAVFSFRVILADLINRTETNRNYQKSDLLQTIRILKNYDFLKDAQLELFKPRKKRRPAATEGEG